MELSEFLKSEIGHYLDSRKEIQKEKTAFAREEEFKIFNAQKDYLKDLDQALENDNLDAAKKLFDELKGHFQQVKPESQDQKKIYKILIIMRQKIKQYIDKKDVSRSLLDEIKDFQPGQEIKSTQQPLDTAQSTKTTPSLQEQTPLQTHPEQQTKQPTDLETESPPSTDLETEQSTQTDQEKEEAISQNLKTIYLLLERRDLSTCIKLYHEIKESFHSLNKDYDPQKEDLYSEIISAYFQIKKLKEIMGQHKEQRTHIKKESKEESKQTFMKLILAKEKLKQATELLEQKKIEEAKSAELDIAAYVADLEETEDLKNILRGLSTLKHKIELARKEKTIQPSQIQTTPYQPSQPQTQSLSEEELYREGKELIYDKQYDPAELIFKQILQLNPTNDKAKLRLDEIAQRREIKKIMEAKHAN